MIRCILLLPEFDLQIIQRSEERLEERESSRKESSPCNISTVFVPPGTLRFCEDVSPILCDGASKHLLPTIYRKGGIYDDQESMVHFTHNYCKRVLFDFIS
jgi:hypothetical protein